MTRRGIKQILPIFLSVILVSAAIILTLYQHWEMTHETWAYWFYARLLAVTGRFPIIDRSPIYVVYLLLFRWLGYPTSVTVEYFVTSLITALCIIVFARRYLGTPLAVFGLILWLPYFQISEPAPQKLALAACVLALHLRSSDESRRNKGLSYGLLLASYLFRASFGVVIVLVALWDFFQAIRIKTISLQSFRLRPSTDWPVVIALIFILIVVFKQSDSPWNNVWAATTTWFPSDGKSFVRMLQNYNTSYILQRYGSFEDHDFYFTNKEVFNGARDLVGAYLVNPRFMRETATAFLREGIVMMTSMTLIPGLLHISDNEIYLHVTVLLLILLGAFMVSKHASMRIFIFGSVAMFALTVLHSPKERYMVFIVPVFLLSAAGYGWVVATTVSGLLRRGPERLARSISVALGIVTSLAVILLLSSGPMSINFSGVLSASWPQLIRTTVEDFQNKSARAMEFRDTSIYFPPMKDSYSRIASLLSQCRGVMTQEYTFISAFTSYPKNNIYDIWEIPPFGDYDGFDYNGLTPERINCLFISKNLKYGVGAGTNSQLRYEHYIKPYTDFLLSKGGVRYPVEGYGEAIVLSGPNAESK